MWYSDRALSFEYYRQWLYYDLEYRIRGYELYLALPRIGCNFLDNQRVVYDFKNY